MDYISTKNKNERCSFEQATIKGLADNKGLYIPESIPVLSEAFFEGITTLSDHEIAYRILLPYVQESIPPNNLRQIVKDAFSFPIPVLAITEKIHVLELFHGPTEAFKDVGARFMSRCFAHFSGSENTVTILVATSGDTGGAVASGFYDVKGVNVKVLFPKGKVSPYQEHQITSLGKNIQAIEIAGTFDDCQNLVKQAFMDQRLTEKMRLSSANSINIARLLPQMLYYFLAYKQIKEALREDKLVISVPSGNLGNLTAGLIAKKMGLPIHRFIAATNANDTFFNYLQSGTYKPKPSVATYSNAMDVGDPSNFERIVHLYNNDLESVKKDIEAFTFDDASTLKAIGDTYRNTGYVTDPHGALGKLALEKSLKEDEKGIFMETAHPRKFEDVVQKVIPEFPGNEVDLSNCSKVSIDKTYKDLLTVL